MRLKLLFLSAWAACCTWACSGNSNPENNTLDSISDTLTAADSTAIIPAQPADSVLTDSVTTAEQAILFMNTSADSAKYAQGILHRMASDNLDYCQRLLKNRYNHFVVVDKQSMHVVLFDRFGRCVNAYKMACARNYGTKHRRNDCRTPEGFFSAGKTYDSRDWLYTNERGYTSPTRGVYGPRFIRITNPVTTSVGIHGTNSPGSLGRRASHGCIRLHNNSILELVEYVKDGMPVIVNPSDRDQQVNRREGYKVGQIHLGSSFKASASAEPSTEETVKQRPDSTRPDTTARPVMADTVSVARPASAPAEPTAPATPTDPAVPEEPQTEPQPETAA